jgi:adenylate cyclase
VPRRGYRLEAQASVNLQASVDVRAVPAGPGRATPSPSVERRLAAILAADIVGYSRLMGSDEVATLTALKAHRRERIDPAIARHHGRMVKTTGDGALVEFPSVVDAVACAVTIQRVMLAFNAGIPEHQRIVFRIGINVGDIIFDGGDIFGDGVNVAARLEALCEPGGVCISRSANEQVRDRLSLRFADLGEQTVKNIARPIGVFGLSVADIAALPEEALPQPEPPEPVQQPVPTRRTAAWAMVAGAIVLTVLLSIVLGLWRYGHIGPDGSVLAPPVQPGRPAIAVLPFASPESDYFAEGMTEDVINALGRFSTLTVMSRNAVALYKGRSVTPQQGRARTFRAICPRRHRAPVRRPAARDSGTDRYGSRPRPMVGAVR